jgi:hypothetical protein
VVKKDVGFFSEGWVQEIVVLMGRELHGRGAPGKEESVYCLVPLLHSDKAFRSVVWFSFVSEERGWD